MSVGLFCLYVWLFYDSYKALLHIPEGSNLQAGLFLACYLFFGGGGYRALLSVISGSFGIPDSCARIAGAILDLRAANWGSSKGSKRVRAAARAANVSEGFLLRVS